MKRSQSFLVLLLLVLFTTGLCGPVVSGPAAVEAAFPPGAEAAGDSSLTLPVVTEDTASFLLESVPSPRLGASGGEWTVIGLSRSGCSVPDGYFDDYYQRIASQVKSQEGILHERKYTEYSRLILALTAIGRDPSDVEGFNLLTPLGDFEKTTWQGINGAIFALLALDCGNYELPPCPGAAVQASRDLYIADVLERQLPDGGFALSGSVSEADVTAMALQALAHYQERPEVAAAVERGVNCLSALQDSQGGYESWGSANLESSAQVLIALCELGIDVNDQRFIKDGHTVIDSMLDLYTPGQGFQHTGDGTGVNGMATEQAFCALVSWQRVSNGESSLYNMARASSPASVESQGQLPPSSSNSGLPECHPDINVPPVSVVAPAFTDVTGHPCLAAIEALASRGIIKGLTAHSFAPDQTMTRAEFAAIITRALGLPRAEASVFQDVAPESWYAADVSTACHYAIVGGNSEGLFLPELTITREEAAVMVARAAALCGFNTSLNESAINLELNQFDDYASVSPWARSSLAFCFQQEILPDQAMEIEAARVASRAEIADMVYRLLVQAELL